MQSIEEINRFEQMLADEGALILKFWFHLSKDAQKKRLKALKADPETRWRVTAPRLGVLQAVRPLLPGLARTRCARRAPRTRRGSSSRAPTRATAPSRWARRCSRRCASASSAPAGRGRPVSKAAPIVPPDRRARRRSPSSTSSRTVTPKTYKAELSELAGAPRPPRARREVPADLGRRGVRGHGRGRQGRHDPPRHRRPRRAPLPRHPDRRADRRGARPALPVALLAPPAAQGPLHDLRPHAGTAASSSSASRASARRPTGCAPTARSTTSRSSSRAHGTVRVQVLAADLPGGAAPALQGARAHALQALQDHRRRTGATARSGTPTRRAASDMIERTRTRHRSLDARRGERQELRARQGARDRLQAHRARVRRGLIAAPQRRPRSPLS